MGLKVGMRNRAMDCFPPNISGLPAPFFAWSWNLSSESKINIEYFSERYAMNLARDLISSDIVIAKCIRKASKTYPARSCGHFVKPAR
jgi:hypothetical protein